MSPSPKQIYYVHLFVVSRFETVGIAADSAANAARLARGWYRQHREELDSGAFVPSDEISHYLVRADGQSEVTAELFESSENPLIAILSDLVAWHDRAPHAKPLPEIVEAARASALSRVNRFRTLGLTDLNEFPIAPFHHLISIGAISIEQRNHDYFPASGAGHNLRKSSQRAPPS